MNCCDFSSVANIPNVAACMAACDVEPGCKAFTYMASTSSLKPNDFYRKRCFFKNNVDESKMFKRLDHEECTFGVKKQNVDSITYCRGLNLITTCFGMLTAWNVRLSAGFGRLATWFCRLAADTSPTVIFFLFYLI